MQILRRLYQVGGDLNGVTWDGIDAVYHDADTYVLERPDGLILFDCGCGDTMDQLLANLRYWNLDADRIRDCLLTRPHVDHAGGGNLLKQRKLQLLARPEEALNEALMQWQ
jgi:glyoxylase-like metal-dependent hydrolase (beta-lactamase superfamily II)